MARTTLTPSQLNADESMTKCPKDRKEGPLSPHSEHNPEGEGTGDASLYRMDSDFPEDGHNDMVLMKQLNNAELARNLLVPLGADMGSDDCCRPNFRIKQVMFDVVQLWWR